VTIEPAGLGDPIVDPHRLAAVRATKLLDTGGEAPFDHLTRVAARVLSVPFAFVTIVDERRSFWKSCYGVETTDVSERQNLVEESFCQYVVRSDGPLLIDDAPANPATFDNPSIESMGVRAWAGWPIRSPEGHVLGTFCAVDVVERRWSDDDDELLSLLAGAAANEIQLRVVAEDAALEAARLSASLLPPGLPEMVGVDVAALHRSAHGPGRVLGDFYDVFHSNRGPWHLLLGDVCGSGLEAASVAAITRWAYHALAEVEDDPDRIFPQINEVLRRQTDGRFVTMQAVSFAGTGPEGALTVRFASAGHHPAIIRRHDGTVEAVDVNGWMLGAFDSLRVGAAELVLGHGDQLVLFTDGLTESRGETGALGEARVAAHVAGLGAVTAQELAGSLMELADTFSGGHLSDDIAVLVLAAV
jgi:serine phosphatase RsbU (regulator of sigma subunit)